MRLQSLIDPRAYVRKVRQLTGNVPPEEPPSYRGDGMELRNKNLGFLRDERFLRAYRRGLSVDVGGLAGDDEHLEFRAHVEMWAASCGKHLDGDFVFCGVNTGIFPLAVSDYIDLNAIDKHMWLFDTFHGIPPEQAHGVEEQHTVSTLNGSYYAADVFDITKKNFAPFPRAHLVRGKIPESLSTVSIKQVCYLSIDMNIALPERAAIEHFWPKLSSGALVVLDDYAFTGHDAQQATMNEFAASQGVSVLTLPTGQGIVKKP